MKKIVTLFIVLVVLTFSSLIKTKAATTLDRIDLYEITIDPNEDGTLNMNFNIEWTVLDSTIEGPLEWIKIGIPNKYVSNINALSSCIKKIDYYSDGGSYIRIDFDRKNYAGEKLSIKFTYTQARMYFLSGNECYYDYKPGWFDEVPVTKAVVKWNKAGTTYANQMSTLGNYYIWTSKLNPGETIVVDVKYDQSYFKNLDPDMQYTDAYMTTGEIIGIVIFIAIVVIVIVIVIISIILKQDPYMKERGFVGRTYYHHHYHRYYKAGYYSSGRRIEKPVVVNSGGFGGSGSSGGSCACACACACAGGGRAGCSMKDFYKHPKLEQIKKALK